MKKPLISLAAILVSILPLVAYLLLRILAPSLADHLTLETLEQMYEHYGPLILLVAGVLEGLVFLNTYVPGSTAILLGAVLASQGRVSLAAVIVWGTSGLVAGYTGSYLIGLLGWHRLLPSDLTPFTERTRLSMERHRLLIYSYSTFHPATASLTALTAGILGVEFKTFFLLITLWQFAWSTAWGLILFWLGYALLTRISYLAVGVLALGLLVVLLLPRLRDSRIL